MPTPRCASARSLPHGWIRAALALLVALVSMARAPRAEAALLVEPATDLHLQLDIPGATVCVVVPRSSQRAEDCDDLNLPALEAMVNGEKDAPTGIALVRFPTWSFSVMVSSQLGVSPRTAEQIEEYAQGVANGAASQFGSVTVHGKKKGSPYDLESINGIHTIRFQVDLFVPKDPSASGPIRLDYGALVGNGGLALVAVVVDQDYADKAEPIARSLLATASMPHPQIADFGQPRGFFAGLLATRAAWAVGGVALLALATITALRRSRKKKAVGKS